MRKLFVFLVLFAAANLSTACMATRKFVRNEVNTTSEKLNSKIDANAEETATDIAEVRDGVDRVSKNVDRVDERVTGVDGKVSQLDSRTTQRFDALTGEVKTVDQKATTAHGAVTLLDERFKNRNAFTVASEKAVYFKFNSAALDEEFEPLLDEIAQALTQNPDALVVMEGRTDSTGNQDYNIRLGERRVEAVRRYLAVEKGVPVYKMHNISFGAARPVADNKSREGREKNRAVTMMILVPKTDSVALKQNNNNNQ
jgi:outer membrane protein OmpA-like peptidoglycan-associated protein